MSVKLSVYLNSLRKVCEGNALIDRGSLSTFLAETLVSDHTGGRAALILTEHLTRDDITWTKDKGVLTEAGQAKAERILKEVETRDRALKEAEYERQVRRDRERELREECRRFQAASLAGTGTRAEGVSVVRTGEALRRKEGVVARTEAVMFFSAANGGGGKPARLPSWVRRDLVRFDQRVSCCRSKKTGLPTRGRRVTEAAESALSPSAEGKGEASSKRNLMGIMLAALNLWVIMLLYVLASEMQKMQREVDTYRCSVLRSGRPR